MEKFDLNNIFQGISTLLQSDPSIMYARIGLILLGILLVYLGRRGILEPLVMIPMGLGMAAVNAGVLIMPGGVQGNLFLDPMVTDTDQLMNILQIDFLQPVYTFMFSNGLIACLIFMGIGTMLDINFLLAKPLQSMFLALCAELGTFAVVPIAFAMGLSPNDSASIAMVGGADGPMVLFASLNLSKSIFVPITVVAYLSTSDSPTAAIPTWCVRWFPNGCAPSRCSRPRKRPNSTPQPPKSRWPWSCA